jgi:hypothetical protein
MGYDPSNYINGVDQRSIPEQRRDEKLSKLKFEKEVKKREQRIIEKKKLRISGGVTTKSGTVNPLYRPSK